ncbi:hypothetical protein ASU32_19060 [Tsukamurella tyrosinosolvens]|nr:hypothetical protein ASU32_19060 [Tsukamurella tyrosinosolvens]
MRYDLDDGFKDLAAAVAAAVVAVQGAVSALGAQTVVRFDKIEHQLQHVDDRSARIGDEVREEVLTRRTQDRELADRVARQERLAARISSGAAGSGAG